MSGVPKYTTPKPFDIRKHRAIRAPDPDATPDWINTPDGPRQAAPGYGTRAKKTMLAAPQERKELPPLKGTEMLFLREVCWDCGGDGYTGTFLYRCPSCGSCWTYEQIEAHGGRDEFGAWRLPCWRQCGKVFSNTIYRVREQCPTCAGKSQLRGHIDTNMRSIGQIMQFIKDSIYEERGINDATLPVHPAFAGSEPSAPAPHLDLGVGMLTPHLTPLSPDEF
ncbi:MAG TPA: hypothetical protein VJO13_10000 [Ktedonobacterales bacterium]|nr:hypothetical protein [Ktedonobacterales bacterium]